LRNFLCTAFLETPAQAEVETVEFTLAIRRVLVLDVELEDDVRFQPEVDAVVELLVAGIGAAGSLVVPFAVAGEHTPLFVEAPGRLDIPAVLLAGAGADGFDVIVDIPLRIQ